MPYDSCENLRERMALRLFHVRKALLGSEWRGSPLEAKRTPITWPEQLN
jgi:hypothetical protein